MLDFAITKSSFMILNYHSLPRGIKYVKKDIKTLMEHFYYSKNLCQLIVSELNKLKKRAFSWRQFCVHLPQPFKCSANRWIKILKILALDSLTGVGVANRTTGEKLEYFSKLECWFGLFTIAFECLRESSASSSGKANRKLVCSVVVVLY